MDMREWFKFTYDPPRNTTRKQWREIHRWLRLARKHVQCILNEGW